MNAGIQVVCGESCQRVPKGDHPLEPNMLKGPNAYLGKEHISTDSGTNPKDHPEHSKKILF
jgi:hypothetical protein